MVDVVDFVADDDDGSFSMITAMLLLMHLIDEVLVLEFEEQ